MALPKILLSAYSVDQKDVSEAQLAYEWIRHLAPLVDLTVFSTGSRFDRPSGLENLPGIRYIQVKESVRWQRWKLIDRAVHPGIIEFHHKVARIARKMAANEKFDLAHLLAPFAPRYASPFRNLGIPSVIGPLMGGQDIPEAFKDIKLKEPFFYRLRELDRWRIRHSPALRKTYQSANCILVMGDYLHPYFPDSWQNRIQCLSSIGVDADQFSPRQDSSVNATDDHVPLRLLYVGRIVPYKGLHYVLRALSALEDSSQVSLTIVGDGPFRAECENLAKELGIENSVIWVGSKSHDEVVEYFHQSDVFIQPAIKEAGGIVILEAMACGLPVICLKRGGPGTIVNSDCGFAIEAISPDFIIIQMARIIDDFRNNPTLLKGMSLRARKTVESQFDWKRLASKIVSVYHSIVP